jgi:glycosyltransferase involved in cell wall biosynthesis
MPKPPLASVIIPCYNCERYLEETIQSVREQTYPEVELVLVDDGSSDNTRAIIERHREEAVCHFGPNRGASAARTTGTALSSGTYIQYLDADDRLRPEALKRRIKALEEADADVAYSQYRRLVVEDGDFVKGPVVDTTLEEIHPDPEIATLGSFWLPPAALTYRRAIVEKIGEWNESLPVIQDARFLQDAAFHGARFVKVAEVLAEYRDHEDGSLSTQDQAAFNRDIWVNARQIEDRWRGRQRELSDAEREALANVYDHCARFFLGVDHCLYAQSVTRAKNMAAEELSGQLKIYVQLESIVGYRATAYVKRMNKKTEKTIKKYLREIVSVVNRQLSATKR